MELRLRGETIAPWPRAVAAIASRQSARTIVFAARSGWGLLPLSPAPTPALLESSSPALCYAELGAGSLEQSLGQVWNVCERVL